MRSGVVSAAASRTHARSRELRTYEGAASKEIGSGWFMKGSNADAAAKPAGDDLRESRNLTRDDGVMEPGFGLQNWSSGLTPRKHLLQLARRDHEDAAKRIEHSTIRQHRICSGNPLRNVI